MRDRRDNFKPGDWTCDKCQDHNFASRNECRYTNTESNVEALIQVTLITLIGITDHIMVHAENVEGPEVQRQQLTKATAMVEGVEGVAVEAPKSTVLVTGTHNL